MSTPQPIHKVMPTKEGEKITLLSALSIKLPSLGPDFKFEPPEVSGWQADINSVLHNVQVVQPAAINFAKAMKQFNRHTLMGTGPADMVPPTFPDFSNAPPHRPGSMNRIVELLERIISSPAYKEEFLGKELNLVRTPAARVEHSLPTFDLAALRGPNHVIIQIMFKKYQHTAVAIDCKINGGEWEFLAINNKKPHLDDRPLRTPGVPEIREYRLRFWDKGVAHGDWSPSQSISITA